MILVAIIIGALIYFIYTPYKAWRLSKNPEWIENQKKIKQLEDEMEVLHKDDEKWDKIAEEGTEAFKKSNDYSTELAMKNLRTEVQRAQKMIKETDYLERHSSIKFKVINASKSDYYNKNIELSGYISISNYYNYGYDNADDTHYSFLLADKQHSDTVQVYFKKGISKTLFDKLIETEELLVKIEAIPNKTKNKNNHDAILLEGIKYVIVEL